MFIVDCANGKLELYLPLLCVLLLLKYCRVKRSQVRVQNNCRTLHEIVERYDSYFKYITCFFIYIYKFLLVYFYYNLYLLIICVFSSFLFFLIKSFASCGKKHFEKRYGIVSSFYLSVQITIMISEFLVCS